MSASNGFYNAEAPDMDGDFEEIRIEVPWGHIAGKWWGPKDVQPILAIHGWQDNAGTFDTLAPRLIRPNISILCIELPGHGYSSHYPAGQFYYIFWDQLVCVRRIVKHFKWDKISILGHSLGGSIGFLYAAIYPNEIDKYIALDIPAPVVIKYSTDVGNHIDKFLRYEKRKCSNNYSWNYQDMLDIVEDTYKHNLTKRSCKILMKRGIKPIIEEKNFYDFRRDVRLRFSAIGLPTNQEIFEYASRITCKVLNIRAESGIFSNKTDFYDSVIDRIKTNASVVEYHNVPGSHHVHLNNPERVSGKWWGPRNVQPILAVHGWQDNAGSFDTLVPLIKNHENAFFCIDLPGHGLSSHQPKGNFYYIFWDGVLTVRRIVKHFNWNKITIMGHSLGGGIAFLYASLYPNDIEKYIAIDIAAPTPREPRTIIPLLGSQIDRLLTYENGITQDYGFEDLMNKTVSGYQGSLTEASARILLKRGAKKTAPNQDSYNYTRDSRLKLIGFGVFTLEQILIFASRIRCDVLNIRSTISSRLQSTEIYDTITSAIAQATTRCETCLVEGTHHVHLNNPERVSKIIVDFLKVSTD